MSDLVGLQVQLQRPFQQPCCKGVAIIGSSTRVHAASLRCANCGRHCGWMPGRVITAISEVVKRFGRPTEPINLKTITTKEEPTMAKDAKYDDTNRGALFKNDKKEGDRDPDYNGHLNVDGAEFWVSAWINVAKSGMKYMSLSVRSKDQPNDRKSRKADKVDQGNEAFGLG
jgi:hypothetical protein